MMKTLQSLKKSIDSASTLHDIVNTMKIHASTNIIQFQQAANASMQYRHVLHKALFVVLMNKEISPSPSRKRKGHTIHVVFSSDHGLCGSFNERIAMYARSKVQGDNEDLMLIVGQQGLRRLETDYVVKANFTVPQTTDGVTVSVQNLLSELDQIRSDIEVDKIELHYNKPTGKAGFNEQTEKLFPLNLSKISKEKAMWKANSSPTYYMSEEKLFSDLLKQYFFITLYRTFCYSLVAENESRIASMTSAKKNIEERLDVLEAEYKRMRQDSITDEIREITAGFIGMKKSK